MLVLAEDSGLFVPALGGKPGVWSARFAGPDARDAQNLEKLLNEMRNIKKRTAKFISALTISKNGNTIKSFLGKVTGKILFSPRGASGFGYDPVFFYPPFNKTFAEIPTEKKNSVSHRSAALRKFLKWGNSQKT